MLRCPCCGRIVCWRSQRWHSYAHALCVCACVFACACVCVCLRVWLPVCGCLCFCMWLRACVFVCACVPDAPTQAIGADEAVHGGLPDRRAAGRPHVRARGAAAPPPALRRDAAPHRAPRPPAVRARRLGAAGRPHRRRPAKRDGAGGPHARRPVLLAVHHAGVRHASILCRREAGAAGRGCRGRRRVPVPGGLPVHRGVHLGDCQLPAVVRRGAGAVHARGAGAVAGTAEGGNGRGGLPVRCQGVVACGAHSGACAACGGCGGVCDGLW